MCQQPDQNQTCGRGFYQDFVNTSSDARRLFELLTVSDYQTNIDKLQAQDNNSIQSSSAAPPEDSASNDNASSSHQRSLACATQSSDQPSAQNTEDDVTKATPSTPRDEFKLR